jgi:ATP-dependent 26S proteasome regulatory subunit
MNTSKSKNNNNNNNNHKNNNNNNNNEEDDNDIVKLVNLLGRTSQQYAEFYSSPYFSGYTSFKSNRNKYIYKSDRIIKKLQMEGIEKIQGKEKMHIAKVKFLPSSKLEPGIKINPYVEERKLKHVNIEQEIASIKDLITLCEKYPLDDGIQYNINMNALHNIKEPLQQMDNMIGLKEIKSSLVDQIIYYVQELHMTTPTCQSEDFMHTVIYGPPGTGKTEIAKIIGNIFSNIGVLKNKVFKKVTRDDLIAGYLGQTAIKTKDIIKECIGGVLFIDEVYSLGNAEKRDSFSKECIDTLCEALSDHKGQLMCIIAGYKEEIKNCFFNFNDGLESRFPWQYSIDKYSADELLHIFHKKVKQIGWSLNHDIDTLWFHKNLDSFQYYGRDMETLLSKVKIAHSKRVFCLPKTKKTIITEEDVNEGFKNFINSESIVSRYEKTNITKSIQNSMYV